MATVDVGLIGRDGELSRLSRLVDPPPTASQVQVLLGEPGMGKTVLLTKVMRRAKSAGQRVLTVTGRESERDLAFAGLHQLLRPLLDRVQTLPDRQAQALLSAFALAPDPVPPDALLTGIAVLTLLSGLAEHGPVLVAVDDGQWLDRASLDTLAFVARRLESEPLVVLLAARGTAAPAGFTTDFPELILPPLDRPEAGRLLDEQPHPPRGRAREQVLGQAAQEHIGWALVWSSQHAAALATLLPIAEQASAQQPVLAWKAIGFAATVAYQSGAPADRAAVLRTLDRMHEPESPPADWSAAQADEQRVWVRACTEPVTAQADAVAYLHRITERTLIDPATVGAAAWLLDETELAVQLLREALSRLRAPGLRGGSGGALSALQWACVDSGRWDEALAAAQEARDAAAAYRMETVAASADLCTASVYALRGDQEQVRSLLASALTHADAMEYRSAAARVRHSAGMAALAEGRFVAAYAQLRHLFRDDGEALHHRVSYLGIADLAAAVRAERELEARTLVDRILAPLDAAAGPRLHQLAERARAVLAEPAQAQAHFDNGLSDQAGDHWPFERAQLRLDYGEWLRRQRRINDAKPVLAAALETLRRLGATPWTRRAEAELRACGVTTQAQSTAPDPLAGLTAQQREIVVLASRGLTNGEIADRLFLSPRTVASHLYRAYPKLGIAGRHQLRVLHDQTSNSTP